MLARPPSTSVSLPTGTRNTSLSVIPGLKRLHFPRNVVAAKAHWQGRGTHSTAASKSVSVVDSGNPQGATTPVCTCGAADIARASSSRPNSSPRQEVCSLAECQRRRRADYHRAKLAADPEYRDVCRVALASGASSIPTIGTNTGKATPPRRNRTAAGNKPETADSACDVLQTPSNLSPNQ